MKFLVIAPLFLASCSIPLPENDYVEGKAGFFKETDATDPAGKAGLFFSRPEVVIEPTK